MLIRSLRVGITAAGGLPIFKDLLCAALSQRSRDQCMGNQMDRRKLISSETHPKASPGNFSLLSSE